MTEPTHSLSIDIGGTFTDFTLLNIESGELNVHKVLTDPENPTTALMRESPNSLKQSESWRPPFR